MWITTLRPTNVDQSSFAYLNLSGIARAIAFDPARAGFTEVGTPTLTGRYIRIGPVIVFAIEITPGTTVASVGDTSYVSLPVEAKAAGLVVAYDLTTVSGAAVGRIDVTNSRAYPPAWGASGNTRVISGYYWS